MSPSIPVIRLSRPQTLQSLPGFRLPSQQAPGLQHPLLPSLPADCARPLCTVKSTQSNLTPCLAICHESTPSLQNVSTPATYHQHPAPFLNMAFVIRNSATTVVSAPQLPSMAPAVPRPASSPTSDSNSTPLTLSMPVDSTRNYVD